MVPPAWKKMRAWVLANGPTDKRHLPRLVGASEAAIHSALAQHREFSCSNGVVTLRLVEGGSTMPGEAVKMAVVLEEEEKPPPKHPGSASWEELLLAKFPSFDPSWPDNVKIEWFSAFGSLMRVKP